MELHFIYLKVAKYSIVRCKDRKYFRCGATVLTLYVQKVLDSPERSYKAVTMFQLLYRRGNTPAGLSHLPKITQLAKRRDNTLSGLFQPARLVTLHCATSHRKE